jgi:uncharacterized membrane protein YdjX (TVP38/TMEM64 family)
MTEQHQSARRALWPRLLLLLALPAALAALYASGLLGYLEWDFLRGSVAGWREQAQGNLAVAALLFFTAYVALTLLPMPVAGGLSVLCGALFDRWLGLSLVTLGGTTAATLSFLAGRYLLHDFVRDCVGQRLHLIDRGVRRDGAFYLFTLRVAPVPFFLVNLGMALTQMRLVTFVCFTWLGLLLPCFFYVNAGSEIARIERPSDALSPPVVVSLVLAGVMPLACRFLLRFAARCRASRRAGRDPSR